MELLQHEKDENFWHFHFPAGKILLQNGVFVAVRKIKGRSFISVVSADLKALLWAISLMVKLSAVNRAILVRVQLSLPRVLQVLVKLRWATR